MALTAPPPEAIEEQVRRMRRLSPTSVAAHTWVHLRDERAQRIALYPVHQITAAYLQETKRYRGVVFVEPPGYGKSTLMQSYVTWRQGMTGGRRRMAIISNTASQAEAFASSIQQIIVSEEYQETYPEVVRDPARKWTTREMYFANTPQGANPGLLALGMDGPILGKRLDEIVIDDPTTWRQARSDAVMTEQREKLLNTIAYRFPPGARPPFSDDGDTRMLVFMTRYGERDLLPTFRDDLGFLVVHLPALGYWDRLVTCTDCGKRAVGKAPCEHDPAEYEVEWGQAALWPERENRQLLAARREHDELIFELVDQGNPAVLSGDMFDSNWWRFGELPGRFDLIVMGVDTAGGRDRKKGDYTAIAVLGIRGDSVWLIYAFRDRLAAPLQESKIKSVYNEMMLAELRPEMVYVEDKNEGRAVYDHLVSETRLPLKAVSPTMDKEFRAIPLSNAARRGAFWMPEREQWTRSVCSELEAFPEGAHDDYVDAITLAYNETEGGGHTGARLRVLG